MGEGKISAGKEKVRSAHCGGGHVVWQSSSRNPRRAAQKHLSSSTAKTMTSGMNTIHDKNSSAAHDHREYGRVI